MTTAPCTRNTIEQLPAELVGLVLQSLDFDSVAPFLEAYPQFKKNVLLVEHEDSSHQYFDIKGAWRRDYLPQFIGRVIRNQTIHLILVNLTPEHYKYNTDGFKTFDEAFYAPVFALLLLHSPSRVLIHSTLSPDKPPHKVYECYRPLLLHKGFRIKEDYDTSFTRMLTQSGHKLEESCHSSMSSIHDLALIKFGDDRRKKVMLYGYKSYTNIKFERVDVVSIEFPLCSPGERSSLSQIHFDSCVKEIHIKYHGVPPTFENITYGSLDPEQGSQSTNASFTLMDSGTQVFNEFRRRDHAEDTIKTSGMDLSWIHSHQNVIINGGPTEAILSLLNGARIKHISLYQTRDTTKRISTGPSCGTRLRFPELESFRFSTSCPNTIVPSLDAPSLKEVYLMTHCDGFRYQSFLESISTARLSTLSVDCEMDSSYQWIGGRVLTPIQGCLSELVLRGLSVPCLESPVLEFPLLKKVTLSLVREISGDCGEDVNVKGKYLSDTLSLCCLRSSLLHKLVVGCSVGKSRFGKWTALIGPHIHALGIQVSPCFRVVLLLDEAIRNGSKNPDDAVQHWWFGPSNCSWDTPARDEGRLCRFFWLPAAAKTLPTLRV